jgi:hypothetical protein
MILDLRSQDGYIPVPPEEADQINLNQILKQVQDDDLTT